MRHYFLFTTFTFCMLSFSISIKASNTNSLLLKNDITSLESNNESNLDKKLKNNELIINNVTLISPERLRPLEAANVKIVAGKISEISTKPIIARPNTKIIDATGQYLTPGLMDSHVHLSLMPGLKFEDLESSSPLQQDFLIQQPRSYLYFGVTQLLDPSQSAQAINAFNDANPKPDLFHCGAVPIVGGYPAVWVSKEASLDIFRYLIIDDTDINSLPIGIDPSRMTPEAVVKRIAEDGAICVKVFIEDGFGLDSKWPLISQSLLKRVQKSS